MRNQDQQKNIVKDEKVAGKEVASKLRLIDRLKISLKNFFKKIISKLKLKFRAFLSRMKKIFILQEEEKVKKKLAKQAVESPKREIPSVLKDVADLETKVDLFLQNHHELSSSNSSINYAMVERVKAEENKKNIAYEQHKDSGTAYISKHLERKSPVDRLSANSIDLISTEILKNHKVKSFIERELSRNSEGNSNLVVAI
jgi:hypothetical protein